MTGTDASDAEGPVTTPGTPTGGAPSVIPDPRGVLRRAWENVPLLLVTSLLVCGAALVCLLVAQTVPALALIPAVLLGAPAAAGAFAVGDAVVADLPLTLRGAASSIRRQLRTLLLLAAAPAVLAALTATALLAHARGGGPMMLVPAAVGASCGVLAMLAAVLGGALAIRLDRRRGTVPSRAPVAVDAVRLAALALHVLARSPIPLFAALALTAAGIWLSVTVSNGIALVVPAPCALVLALAFESSPSARALDL